MSKSKYVFRAFEKMESLIMDIKDNANYIKYRVDESEHPVLVELDEYILEEVEIILGDTRRINVFLKFLKNYIEQQENQNFFQSKVMESLIKNLEERKENE